MTSHDRWGRASARQSTVDFHPGMIAAGLLCAFAALLLSALIVSWGEPAASDARESREDLARQEALHLAPAESRR